jgi:hypothetical protein
VQTLKYLGIALLAALPLVISIRPATQWTAPVAADTQCASTPISLSVRLNN